uniref:Uncharacterized protein n=1 Tax=Palpitomonas bilix TaxID=652834 RepID=A0A7S3D3V2_9EUKA|mmetsp:Transcript_18893/g.48062  ORF Transcript_18893/g.48062 Transcript_18893/m.48062 type:complete len:713 (+) Transcript_18893:220-2358(+)
MSLAIQGCSASLHNTALPMSATIAVAKATEFMKIVGANFHRPSAGQQVSHFPGLRVKRQAAFGAAVRVRNLRQLEDEAQKAGDNDGEEERENASSRLPLRLRLRPSCHQVGSGDSERSCIVENDFRITSFVPSSSGRGRGEEKKRREGSARQGEDDGGRHVAASTSMSAVGAGEKEEEGRGGEAKEGGQHHRNGDERGHPSHTPNGGEGYATPPSSRLGTSKREKRRGRAQIKRVCRRDSSRSTKAGGGVRSTSAGSSLDVNEMEILLPDLRPAAALPNVSDGSMHGRSVSPPPDSVREVEYESGGGEGTSGREGKEVSGGEGVINSEKEDEEKSNVGQHSVDSNERTDLAHTSSPSSPYHSCEDEEDKRERKGEKREQNERRDNSRTGSSEGSSENTHVVLATLRKKGGKEEVRKSKKRASSGRGASSNRGSARGTSRMSDTAKKHLSKSDSIHGCVVVKSRGQKSGGGQKGTSTLSSTLPPRYLSTTSSTTVSKGEEGEVKLVSSPPRPAMTSSHRDEAGTTSVDEAKGGSGRGGEGGSGGKGGGRESGPRPPPLHLSQHSPKKVRHQRDARNAEHDHPVTSVHNSGSKDASCLLPNSSTSGHNNVSIDRGKNGETEAEKAMKRAQQYRKSVELQKARAKVEEKMRQDAKEAKRKAGRQEFDQIRAEIYALNKLRREVEWQRWLDFDSAYTRSDTPQLVAEDEDMPIMAV